MAGSKQMDIQAGQSKRTGKSRRAAHAVVGVLLGVALVLVMATALIEEAPHEYLGIALVVLTIAHVVQKRRWFAGLRRGRWSAVRVLQALAIAGLIACLVGQVVSAVVLSRFALGFLPALPGASWARSVHMLCAYWMFVCGFAHMGLQFKTMLARMGFAKSAKPAVVWLLRVVWLAVAVWGAWMFVRLDIASYLLARVQFASAEFSAPLLVRVGHYSAIAALIVGVFHYLRCALGYYRKSKHTH
ncbi:MAG: DUF4405 domain-containing protein [Atopobiaceae bacterium]|nr:DUF4405 domain-containing protein [Atopobiaceae bacterium]